MVLMQFADKLGFLGFAKGSRQELLQLMRHQRFIRKAALFKKLFLKFNKVACEVVAIGGFFDF
jgi:hypothetical protein